MQKMSYPLTKKPFSGKIFYLDLKTFRDQEELMKDLKKLGGKVESFLSKDVTHVLTDRKEHSKRELMGPDGSSMNIPPWTSSKRHNSSPLHFINSPAYSPANEGCHSRSPVISRGLALVQKAQQKREGTTDLMEVCTQWKIKIVHIQVVTSWIYQFKVEYTKSVHKLIEKQVGNKEALGPAKIEYRKLSVPFIKVEDLNMRYRPVFKELKSWEDFVDPGLHSACSAVMRDVLLPNTPTEGTASDFRTRVLKDVNTDVLQRNCFNFKIHPLKSTESSISMLKSFPNKSKIRFGKGLKENMPLWPEGEKKKRKTSVLTTLRFPKEEKIKKLKKKYCEICCCSYIDLDHHLHSATHQKYFSNPDNFMGLEKIIQTFPHTTDFLNKWMNHEKENPVFRHMSSCEKHIQDTDFEACESKDKISIPGNDPIPKYHTANACFRDVINTCYSDINHKPGGSLSHLPVLEANYVNCENTNHVSMYCEEKYVFNTSLAAYTDNACFVNENGSSNHAIDLCTRNTRSPLKKSIAECSTEIYDCCTADFISASCSSETSSSTLPYLEDSIEKLTSTKTSGSLLQFSLLGV